MALFRRPSVTDRLVELFAEAGHMAVAVTAPREEDGELRVDGVVITLRRIVVSARAERGAAREAMLRTFVAGVATNGKHPEHLDAGALRAAARVRLLPRRYGNVPMPDHSRPFAGDLVETLGIDLGMGSVANVPDDVLPDLALGVEELYATGRENVRRLPIERSGSYENGLHLLWGSSIYTTSKAADTSALVHDHFDEPEFGVVFALPDRHAVFFVPVDANASGAVEMLERTIRMAEAAGDGEVLGRDVLFWRDRVLDVVGGTAGTPADSTRLAQAIRDADA